MNTKKLLISGAIATGMLVGVAMPSAFAASKVTFQKDYLEAGKTVTIMQNADGKSVPSIDLKAEDVKTVIENKFKGTTVKDELSKVGTGTVVELADGEKITVVYKGDVNGDGKVSVADAGLMVRSSFGAKKLTPAQEKAGDIGGTANKVNSADAGVVVRLLFGGKNAETAYNKMEEFMPEDVVVVDNKTLVEEAEKVAESEKVQQYCDEVKVELTENGAKAEVKIKDDQKDVKLSDVKSQLKETVLALATEHSELIEAAKSVKLHYDNGTEKGIDLDIDLTNSEDMMSTLMTVKNAINNLLGDKTLASLMGDKLTVTVDLDTEKALLDTAKDSAQAVYVIDFGKTETEAK